MTPHYSIKHARANSLGFSAEYSLRGQAGTRGFFNQNISGLDPDIMYHQHKGNTLRNRVSLLPTPRDKSFLDVNFSTITKPKK